MNSDIMSIDDLKNIVEESLLELYEKDRDLIVRGVHEVSICHRFAVILEEKLKGKYFLFSERNPFSSFKVDLEYNKNGDGVKDLIPGGWGKRPDLIVHKRKSNKFNLLVIEMKKNQFIEEGEDDDLKLKGATNPNHHYAFQLGAYLDFKKEKVFCTWYQNGKKCEEETISALKGRGE